MTYQIEFPDFDPTTMPDIPEGWIDVSWHNDACPCFEVPAGLFVYVDYLDPAKREMGDTVPRFSILNQATNFSTETDSWEDVKEFVSNYGVDKPGPV